VAGAETGKLQHNSNVESTATASRHFGSVPATFVAVLQQRLQHAARRHQGVAVLCRSCYRQSRQVKNNTINGGDGSCSQKRHRFNGNSINVAAAFQHLLPLLISMQRAMASGSGGALKQVLPAVVSGKTKTINGSNGSCSQTAARCRQQQHCGVW